MKPGLELFNFRARKVDTRKIWKEKLDAVEVSEKCCSQGGWTGIKKWLNKVK